jgi:hypothetical protein
LAKHRYRFGILRGVIQAISKIETRFRQAQVTLGVVRLKRDQLLVGRNRLAQQCDCAPMGFVSWHAVVEHEGCVVVSGVQGNVRPHIIRIGARIRFAGANQLVECHHRFTRSA